MKLLYGILGYIAVVHIATTECAAEDTLNSTTTVQPAIVIHEKEKDDFVPHRKGLLDPFDWTLFKCMSKQYPANTLLSPVSLKLALILLYEGALDLTARELANVMQLPSNLSVTRNKFSSILQSLETTSPSYNLNIGTRIYIDSSIQTSQRYSAIIKTFYNSDLVIANLSNAQPVVQEINSWVSNITDNNIEQMIEDESSVTNSLMLILNALFFKGTWKQKYFIPDNTRMGTFNTNAGQTVTVPYMHAVSRFYYLESRQLDAKILRIPYQGHKYAMYLILPRTQNGADQLINKINPFLLTQQMWLLRDLPVDVLIPKFKYQFSSHLESILRELGIRDIFEDTAVLTGIQRTKQPSKHLKVTDILQKSGIEVNEKGTQAYVATEIEIGNKIEDETFHATHPFIFFIEDESTGTIIYIGRLTNPLDTPENTANSAQ